jgi:hypothetical protein
MSDLETELESLEKDLKLLINESWPSMSICATQADYDKKRGLKLQILCNKQDQIIFVMRQLIEELKQKNEDLGYEILERAERDQLFD